MSVKARLLLAAILSAVIAVAVVAALPAFAAACLLYRIRHPVDRPIPQNCEDATFAGVDVTLKGWRCHGLSPVQGTLIYLHGVTDNRASATGVIQRFVSHGFD